MAEIKVGVKEVELVVKVKSEEGALTNEQKNAEAKADTAADNGYNGYDDGQDRYDDALHLLTYPPN